MKTTKPALFLVLLSIVLIQLCSCETAITTNEQIEEVAFSINAKPTVPQKISVEETLNCEDCEFRLIGTNSNAVPGSWVTEAYPMTVEIYTNNTDYYFQTYLAGLDDFRWRILGGDVGATGMEEWAVFPSTVWMPMSLEQVFTVSAPALYPTLWGLDFDIEFEVRCPYSYASGGQAEAFLYSTITIDLTSFPLHTLLSDDTMSFSTILQPCSSLYGYEHVVGEIDFP